VMQIGNEWNDRLAKAMRINDRSKREMALQKIDGDQAGLAKSSKSEGLGEKLFSGFTKSRKQISNQLGYKLATMQFSIIWNMQNAKENAEQHQRHLRIAFAVAGFHADHGRYPQQLQEIVPTYLKKLPKDLFSGKSIVYRLSKDGYLLYSVGENGKDDLAWHDLSSCDDLRMRMPFP